jgi:hypothetical protein
VNERVTVVRYRAPALRSAIDGLVVAAGVLIVQFCSVGYARIWLAARQLRLPRRLCDLRKTTCAVFRERQPGMGLPARRGRAGATVLC